MKHLRCWLRGHDYRMIVGRNEALGRGVETTLMDHVVGKTSMDMNSDTSYARCRRCGRTIGRVESEIYAYDDPRLRAVFPVPE